MAVKGKTESWSLEQRRNLEHLFKEAWNIKSIQEILHISYFSLKKELRRGLTEEEYLASRYGKYSAERATIAEIRGLFSDDEIRLIIENGERYLDEEKDEGENGK